MVSLLFEYGLVLLEIGIILVLVIGFTKILRNFEIPNVLGLIIGGLIINIIFLDNSFSTDFISLKTIITELALAYIGYKIGNEIDLEVLRDKGKKFGLILIGEAFGAFIIITIGLYIITNDLGISLLLGSIGMATAPAATTHVLSEYKSEGELTQTILFVIAFDDTLAILFVNLSLGYISHAGEEIIDILPVIVFELIIEVLIAITLGLIGTILIMILAKSKIMTEISMVEWILGIAFILIGLSMIFNVSVILTMFIWGISLKILEKKPSYSLLEEQLGKIEVLTLPVITFFFILVGLLMDIDLLFEFATLAIATSFFIFRGLGKGIGSYSASILSNLDNSVKNNIPISLFTQAGVAIGLASLSYNHLISLGYKSDAIFVINIIGVSVLLSEFIGPFLVKKAIFRAKENDKKLQTK